MPEAQSPLAARELKRAIYNEYIRAMGNNDNAGQMILTVLLDEIRKVVRDELASFRGGLPADPEVSRRKPAPEKRTAPERKRFYTAKEVAVELSLSTKTVRRLIDRGLLRPNRATRLIRIFCAHGIPVFCAATFTHPASMFWRRISTPRQEHQVGCFLGISEKRLARRAYLRTHGKATSKINELACADGHRKVGRDFSSGDPVPEATFHQRRGARDRALQEPPNLSVVHKRRDAPEKTATGASFFSRAFDGVPQKARERIAKTLWREECLRG